MRHRHRANAPHVRCRSVWGARGERRVRGAPGPRGPRGSRVFPRGECMVIYPSVTKCTPRSPRPVPLRVGSAWGALNATSPPRECSPRPVPLRVGSAWGAPCQRRPMAPSTASGSCFTAWGVRGEWISVGDRTPHAFPTAASTGRAREIPGRGHQHTRPRNHLR